MVGWDSGANLADRFRTHAGDARHLYGYAMRGMAEDWEAGGVVRTVCAGYEDAPSGSAIQLRLLAAVFRLVLRGAAPQLRPYYPCLGGEGPPSEAWPVLRQVIAEHLEEVRAGLQVAPQTNEVGRSAALLVGLFDLVATSGVRRVRLLEVGASAGLNLLVDRFGFGGAGPNGSWRWGLEDSPVQLVGAIEGVVRPESFSVLARRGCDLSPVDATTPDGRLLLTSFVWPFHLHRHQRLAGALRVLEDHPVTVDAAGASDWLPAQLAAADPDELTVVWHSVTQLYWPPAEIDAVDRLLDERGATQLLGRVGMEFDAAGDPHAMPQVRTELRRPGQALRSRLLGTAHHHGVPVRLPPDEGLPDRELRPFPTG